MANKKMPPPIGGGEVKEKIKTLLAARYPTAPGKAIDYLLDFMSTWDLIDIRDRLAKEDKRREPPSH